MSPYRRPVPPAPAPAPDDARGALREERWIYGFCVAFGVSRLVHALWFEAELGPLSAIAIVLAGWGARALVLSALRRV
jgi:hypothetical protein